MYEVVDPNYYLSTTSTKGKELEYVHHLKQNFSLLAFKEEENLKIIAPPELEKYITRENDKSLKITSRLLLLRDPEGELIAQTDALQKQQQEKEEKKAPLPSTEIKPLKENEPVAHDSSVVKKSVPLEKNEIQKTPQKIVELYDPKVDEVFSIDLSGGICQEWIEENFIMIDGVKKEPHHQDYGVIFIQNPYEFRITRTENKNDGEWHYDPKGVPVKSLDELKSTFFGFHSRKELIEEGEKLYAIEGCWYCHTDQTRTLIEDVVINGLASYPAPPSSANEFIYQKITFPGTRRIGPDLSRAGVKRASRDWNKTHFWAPQTVIIGSIMPAFKHFFDPNPMAENKNEIGIPNQRFEAIYQYMMTKGTRITPPTQAWWLGKDPIRTKEIIEGQRKLP